MPESSLMEKVLSCLGEFDGIWDMGELGISERRLDFPRLWHLLGESDEELVGLLFQDSDIREKFFKPLKAASKEGVQPLVFCLRDFRRFMEAREIDGSTTAYSTHIGLASNGRFLRESRDVVIDFPFKDCVLKGGEKDREGRRNRKEIFLNMTLAHDRIDRMLERKALVNWRGFRGGGFHLAA